MENLVITWARPAKADLIEEHLAGSGIKVLMLKPGETAE